MEVEGWILDAYPGKPGEMVVWLKKPDGGTVRFTDSWWNAIYVSTNKKESLERIAEWAEHQLLVYSAEFVQKREHVFDYGEREVLKLILRNGDDAEKLAKEVEPLDVGDEIRVYNADLLPAQVYFIEKDLFPLAKVKAEQIGDAIRWQLEDSVMAEEYQLPALKRAVLKVVVYAAGRIARFNDPIDKIILTTPETSVEIGEGSERDKLLGLVQAVKELDPDILFVERGDDFTTHYLAERAYLNGVADQLILGRDAVPIRRLKNRGTSYFAYGRILHTPTSHKLFGRINLDAENFFVYSECGLDGLFEVVRLCRMPLHKGSRASIGKCLSSLQAYIAFKDNLLIPWKPTRAEVPKSGKTLLLGDRGGFIYEPKIGVHESVGEIDYTCLAGSSVIETREGKKEISKATEKDEVLTPFGWQRIVKITRYRIRNKVVKLSLEDGSALTSTLKHRFPVLIKRIFTEKRAEEIHRGNTLVTTDFSPNLQKDEIATLFGVYAAEGSYLREDKRYFVRARNRIKMFRAYGISFDISAQENDLRGFIIRTLRMMHPSAHTYTRLKKDEDRITVSISQSKAVEDFIFRYRHFLARSDLSSTEKASFLRGFFEGDGGVNIGRNTVQFNQSVVNSEKLDIVLRFLRDLGIKYRNFVFRSSTSYSSNPANYVELSSLEGTVRYYTQIGFISKQKQEKLRNAIRTCIRKAKYANRHRFGLYAYSSEKNHLSFIHKTKVVKKEILDYEGDVFDITLEWSEFPFYFANGILTHNSLFPFIMKNHNISAETVLCKCCRDSKVRVPDVDYNLCERRTGLIPRSLEPILRKRVAYKRLKKETKDPQLAKIYNSRVDALKGILVCCLTRDSPILIQRDGETQYVKIGDFIDNMAGENEGVIDCPPGILVAGLGRDLKARFCKVSKLIKVRNRGKILRVTLGDKRQIVTTADHPFFVLNEGELETRAAETIKKGDLVPVAKRIGYASKQIDPIDLIDWLQKNTDEIEKLRWKVSGPILKQVIAANRKRLTEMAVGAGYTPYAVGYWRRMGMVPLAFFPSLNVAIEDRKDLRVGIGRRDRKGGGRTSWLPAIIPINEELGFFLGLYVSDGSATNAYIRLDIATSEEDLLSNARKVTESLFQVSPRVYKEKDVEMYVLQINSLALVNFVERVLGMPGSAEKGKLKVPNLIFNSDQQTAQGFMEGMLDGDGTAKSRNFVSIGTANQEFANQLGFLAAMLDLGFRIDRNRQEPDRYLYGITFVGPKTLSKIASWRFLKGAQLSIVEPKLDGLCKTNCAHPLYETFPVKESGLLQFAVATRTVKGSRLRQRLSTCPARAERAFRRIDAKEFDGDLRRVSMRAHQLFESDLGFLRVAEVEELESTDEFVYCFQIDDDDLPGFFAGEGAVYTHNCFGYLSYRNAKFGLIDCHISVCAFARKILLDTARIAERRGFDVVHGIVDSLWVRKHGATKEDYLELCQEIEKEIGMPISFEGIYRWVAFLPSRMHEDVPVLNRYFGVFEDGTVKVRGIEMRRRDTIKLVSDCQNEILSLLSSGTTVDEVKQLLPQVVEIVRRYVTFINSGKIPFSDLTIVNGLSKNFNEYGSNQVHVGAIKQLAEEGLELMAGQSVSYVVTNYRSKIPEERARPVELLDDSVTYDKTRYTEILMRGIGTLLEPFGISGERLDHLVRSVGEAKQESVFAADG